MPSVLITRPQAMSEALAATLQGLGFETAIEPLLSVTPLPVPRAPAGPIDAVMITSGNALAALEKQQSLVSGLFDTPCFCIGRRTAEKAKAFGFRHTQNAAGDSGELAALINTAFENKNAAILHIAGREVNELARQQLQARGHNVIAWPVYDVIPAAALTPATGDLLVQRKLDAVMVFSPKTARVLSAHITAAGLEACCTGLAAICLSEAVASDLKSLPWRQVITAPLPTEDAIIACLQEACPVKS